MDYRARYLKLRSVLNDRTTRLPAFPVLIDGLRTLLEQRRRLGVLHVEIVDLRLVESLYGWQVFDRILARAADVLRGLLGVTLPADALLALNAVAGDRFVIFVPALPDGGEVDGRYLGELGREVCGALESSFEGEAFSGLNPRLEFRAGHALLSASPFHRFERRVYAALEEAVAFDSQRRTTRARSWATELQRLIEDEALETVFQPVFDLRSHGILGHEAFARGPKDSPLETPCALFALSTQVGVATELDRLCRKSALRASGPMAGTGKLFLNVLPQCAESSEWGGNQWSALLAASSREPQDLVLELSERAADTDAEHLIEALRRLKERGFGVALDDMGTGFASQAILERARPDYLKLDISLVRGIDRNLVKQEMLATLVRIAGRIGAEVIAEGVETAQEAATLTSAGARYAQGFLFAMPAPPPMTAAGPPGC